KEALEFLAAVQLNADRNVEASLLWTQAWKPPSVRGPMAERIRKALDHKMSFREQGAVGQDVLDALQHASPNLAIQMKGDVGKSALPRADLQEVPLGAVLQWLEDSLQGYRIVVREYGILVAPEKDIPRGAVPLVEFWKGSTEKDSGKKSPKGSS
ncbi:MAG TPA: hypothetical protein VKD72_21230, partial [Gemmataceae bacterium]|nr:hypothetical protein [Gemmataceae bacterium]